MEFIDNLYELYKNKLTGDEEDAFIVIDGIMESFSSEDVENFFYDLSEKDRLDMLALFIYEKFRQKIAKEGIGQTKSREEESIKYYH